jgi:hypothetical protein
MDWYELFDDMRENALNESMEETANGYELAPVGE